MRKFIIFAALAAFASFIVAATASADVARNQEPTTVTFTVTEPANAEHQFVNVWTHTYTVAVQADGSFVGTGEITGSDANGTYDQQVPSHVGADENIVGKFSEVNTVSYVSTRSDGLTYTLTNAPTDGSLITDAQLNVTSPYSLEMRITAPSFSLNHGQYVSSMGGGADAAHSPIGKPVQAKSK